MSRKRAVRVPIHVSIPLGLLERVDDVAANRSGFIVKALKMRLDGDGDSIEEASTRQLMAALAQREDVDATLALLLFAILADPSRSS